MGVGDMSIFRKHSLKVAYLVAAVAVVVGFQNCGGVKSTPQSQTNSTNGDMAFCSDSTTFVDCTGIDSLPQHYHSNGCPKFACSGSGDGGSRNPGTPLCNPSLGIPTCGAGQTLNQSVAGGCLSYTCNSSSSNGDSDFVDGLYLKWFGRTPDVDGKDYWVGVLQTVSRTQAEYLFLEGPIQSDKNYVLANKAEMARNFIQSLNQPVYAWLNPGGGDATPGSCESRIYQNGSSVATSETVTTEPGQNAVVPIVVTNVSWETTGQNAGRFNVAATCFKQNRRCENSQWSTISGAEATMVNSGLTGTVSSDTPNFEIELENRMAQQCDSAVEVREGQGCSPSSNECVNNYTASAPNDNSEFFDRQRFVRDIYREWFNRDPRATGWNYWTLGYKTISEALIECAIVRGARDEAPNFDRTMLLNKRQDVLDLVNSVPGCEVPDWPEW